MNAVSDKALYQSYVDSHGLPVFFQPWYLDAACEEGEWYFAIDIQHDTVRGVWPYMLKKKYGQTYITQPPLTSFLGPYCHRPEDMDKEATWVSHQKSVLTHLFNQIPAHLLLISQWTPSQNNWLPLYWMGCKQTTRYTYQINLNQSIESLWSAIGVSQRNRIRNAEKKCHLNDSEDIMNLWPLLQASYSRQKLSAPYSKSLLAGLDQALQKNQCRKIFFVELNASIVAGLYLIYDSSFAYMTITGRSDEDTIGAVSLAIWEAIQFAKNKGLSVFDFEGSMMPGVEAFFRSFGGNLIPYHRVTHTNGKTSELFFRFLNRI